jgi:hypothetical protein
VVTEDRCCLADCIAEANGDYEAAFRRFENIRSVARRASYSRIPYIWDVYHADGITGEVYWRMLGERSERGRYVSVSSGALSRLP